VRQLSVRRATLLQLHDTVSARATRHRQCIDEAWGGVARDEGAANDDLTAVQPMLTTMAAVWQLKIENRFKQAWWQLTVNAIRHPNNQCMAGATAAQRAQYQCGCGGGQCGRMHHFWECDVAQAVYAEISEALSGTAHLCCPDVWLLEPPVHDPPLQREVWWIVCLAALTAVEKGRTVLCALTRGPTAPTTASDQTLITDYMPGYVAPAPAVPHSVTASRRACHEFWGILHNIAAKGVHGQSMERWARCVPPDHPFLGVVDRTTFVVNAGRDVGGHAAESDFDDDGSGGAAEREGSAAPL